MKLSLLWSEHSAKPDLLLDGAEQPDLRSPAFTNSFQKPKCFGGAAAGAAAAGRRALPGSGDRRGTAAPVNHNQNKNKNQNQNHRHNPQPFDTS